MKVLLRPSATHSIVHLLDEDGRSVLCNRFWPVAGRDGWTVAEQYDTSRICRNCLRIQRKRDNPPLRITRKQEEDRAKLERWRRMAEGK